MLHTSPPRVCWCGKLHAPSEVFNLNVHGRDDLPDGEYDNIIEAESRHQRAVDIAAAGGANLLTNEEADELLRQDGLPLKQRPDEG